MATINTKPRYSYSALFTFLNCPFQFYQKYILKNRAVEETLPLSLGSITHKGKELISKSLMSGVPPDYAAIETAVLNGYTGADKASGEEETLLGVIDIKTKFFDDWVAPDDKSGLSYEEKLENYFDGLREEEADTEWHTIGAEVPFEFDYDDATLFGIIDNVAENKKGQLRCLDYKSSRKVFSETDIKTPLQMVIYYLALQHLYPGREIVQCLYDFMLIGKKQEAGTKGWIKRGKKKLSKTTQSIAAHKESGIWEPCPTPLCHWCPYSASNPKADRATRATCRYHALWTPDNHTFLVANKWDENVARATAKFVI